MINVVIWLGKIKYSEDLAIILAKNNIRIVDEDFEDAEDFTRRFDALDTNVDVLVLQASIALSTMFPKMAAISNSERQSTLSKYPVTINFMFEFFDIFEFSI